MRGLARCAAAAAGMAMLAGALAASADAGTLYVAAHASGADHRCTAGAPCRTIEQALAIAAPGARVVVRPGTYRETVTVNERVSLVGQRLPLIDASGRSSGILISGPGAAKALIRGFRVEHANEEGILARETSGLTIAGNVVLDNDRRRHVGSPTARCAAPGPVPGDCGYGLHLMAVSYAHVLANTVAGNAGGILLSDESGPSAHDVIEHNQVSGNELGCGITLAGRNSRAVTVSAAGVAAVAPRNAGVFDDTVTQNVVDRDGRRGPGGGVGLFGSAPGSAVYDNLVTGNRAEGDGLGGVTLHSNAAGEDLNGNTILGNVLANDGLYGSPGGKPGDAQAGLTSSAAIVLYSAVTALAGTLVRGNQVSHEQIGLWTMNVPAIARSANTFAATVSTPLVQLFTFTPSEAAVVQALAQAGAGKQAGAESVLPPPSEKIQPPPPPPPPPPVDQTLPTIHGALVDGEIVTATSGSWSGPQILHYTYKWESCASAGSCSAISGASTTTTATETSYRLTSATVGKTLRVTVTAESNAGNGFATSKESATVAPGPPLLTASPEISGEVREGQTLTADQGKWAGTPPFTFKYAWERCVGPTCSPIGSGTTYHVIAADFGRTLRLTVTVKNAEGQASAPSVPSAPVLEAEGGKGGTTIGWGEDYYAELGTTYRAPFEERHVPVGAERSEEELTTLANVRAIGASAASGYALRENGTLLAWGGNGHGQLGDGAVEGTWFMGRAHVTVGEEPYAGQVVPLTGISSFAVAAEHALALMDDGSVKAWGNNSYGQMGNGKGGFMHETHERTELPKTVTRLTGQALEEAGLKPVKTLAAGGGSNYAVLEDGKVMAWGADPKGQLGIGEGEPETCHTETGFERCSTIPRLVRSQGGEPLTNVVEVAAGSEAAYARLQNGEVMAWGSNAKGQLGYERKAQTGGKATNIPPKLVVNEAGKPLSNVVSVTAGGNHALALREDGELVGWGNSEEGNLAGAHTEECGPGEDTEKKEKENEEEGIENKNPCVKIATRVIAPGGLGPEGSPITQVAAGGQFNAALDQAGEVFTWGADTFSQLGDGLQTSRATPTKVSEPGPVSAIAAGKKFMITLLAHGTPSPAPVATVEPRVGALDLRWSVPAERLTYRVSEQEPPREPVEAEVELEEAGPPVALEGYGPEITGPPEEGRRLTASKGKWNGARPFKSVKYQWERCRPEGAPIDQRCGPEGNWTAISAEEKQEKGSGENLYKLGPTDVGETLRVKVTVENGIAPAGAATSLPSEEIESKSATMSTASLEVSGKQEYLIEALHERPYVPLLKGELYQLALSEQVAGTEVQQRRVLLTTPR